jgi:hypothetical protein
MNSDEAEQDRLDFGFLAAKGKPQLSTDGLTRLEIF